MNFRTTSHQLLAKILLRTKLYTSVSYTGTPDRHILCSILQYIYNKKSTILTDALSKVYASLDAHVYLEQSIKKFPLSIPLPLSL